MFHKQRASACWPAGYSLSILNALNPSAYLKPEESSIFLPNGPLSKGKKILGKRVCRSYEFAWLVRTLRSFSLRSPVKSTECGALVEHFVGETPRLSQVVL
jgi:hypothetical protein